jgi:hypothetical protein
LILAYAPVICSSRLLRSPHGNQDDGENSHADNDGGEPGNLDVESPSWVEWHTVFLDGRRATI